METGVGIGMNSEAIVTVSAAVVALTQLVKWAGVPSKLGPIVVLVAAGAGVAVWAISSGGIGQKELFELFSGWIAVATSAAGVFGFTRAGASSVVEVRRSGKRK